jgi:hypothetical protein
MKNLQKFNVQELSVQEQKEIDGNFGGTLMIYGLYMFATSYNYENAKWDANGNSHNNFQIPIWLMY